MFLMQDTVNAVKTLLDSGFKPVPGMPDTFYRSRGGVSFGRAIVPYRERQFYIEQRGPIENLPILLNPPGPELTAAELAALEFYVGYGLLGYAHQNCTCADCQTDREAETHLTALRGLVARAKDANGTTQEGNGDQNG